MLGDTKMIDELKDKINLAQKSVEDIQDPTLKEKAFEVILNNLMKGNGATNLSPVSPNQEPGTTGDNKFMNLLNAAKISEEQLFNVIDVDGEKVHLIKSVPGTTESKKQAHTAIVLLTISHYMNSEREITTMELKKTLQDQGIGSLQNLSSNLKGYENFLLMKGSKGSKSTTYRITTPGINKGIELIKEMV